MLKTLIPAATLFAAVTTMTNDAHAERATLKANSEVR
jgi:hypothetical protein